MRVSQSTHSLPVASFDMSGSLSKIDAGSPTGLDGSEGQPVKLPPGFVYDWEQIVREGVVRVRPPSAPVSRSSSKFNGMVSLDVSQTNDSEVNDTVGTPSVANDMSTDMPLVCLLNSCCQCLTHFGRIRLGLTFSSD